MSVGGNRTLHYDIENVKKFPEVFKDGEEVVICEKIHGSNCQINIMSDSQRLNDTEDDDAFLIIASKGVGAKGLAFKIHAEANKNNLYVKTAMRLNLVEGCYNAFGTEESVFVIGEIYGKGVQDLTYGLVEPEFRIFDIYIGNPGEGRFLGDLELDKACKKLVIPRVPVLYRGPFSKEVLDTWTNGKETVSGQSSHVREGVVVRTSEERLAGADLPCHDRCQLKSVSEGYLLRKSEDATEYA